MGARQSIFTVDPNAKKTLLYRLGDDASAAQTLNVDRLGEQTVAILKPVCSIDAAQLEFSCELRTRACDAYLIMWVHVKDAPDRGPFFGKGVNVVSSDAGDEWTRVSTLFWLRPGEFVSEISLGVFASPPRDKSCAARQIDVRNVELSGTPLKIVAPRPSTWAELTGPLASLKSEVDEAEQIVLESEFVHLNA